MKASQFLNLIPIGALVWFILIAIKRGSVRDPVDGYFQGLRTRAAKIRESVNWFGVPRP